MRGNYPFNSHRKVKQIKASLLIEGVKPRIEEPSRTNLKYEDSVNSKLDIYNKAEFQARREE